jgi:hypothetical protein
MLSLSFYFILFLKLSKKTQTITQTNGQSHKQLVNHTNNWSITLVNHTTQIIGQISQFQLLLSHSKLFTKEFDEAMTLRDLLGKGHKALLVQGLVVLLSVISKSKSNSSNVMTE